jgi:DNA repair ATPase RecN
VGNVLVTRMVGEVKRKLSQAVSAMQRDAMSSLMLSDLDGARAHLGALRRMGPALAAVKDAPDVQRAARELDSAIVRREEEMGAMQRLKEEMDANRNAREAIERQLELLQQLHQTRNEEVPPAPACPRLPPPAPACPRHQNVRPRP